MNPTIRDVAKLAGVSVATASRVLSGSVYPVAPDVRGRVLKVAEQLAFTPNAFARGLSRRECHFIGLVVPNIKEPFFLEIGVGCETVASQYGYMVVLCNTNRDLGKEAKYLQELRAMRAGVILVGRSGYSEELLRELSRHPAPVVVIGRHQLAFSSVQFDNPRGAEDATDHLVSIGRRRIAFIGGPSSSTSAVDRLEGFRRAMRRHGVACEEEMVVESDYSLEGGDEAMRRLLKLPTPPDAVLAANDQLAIGAMHRAKRSGLRIPEDLAVAGFNDVPIAAYVDPPLTTIRLPLHNIGEMAAGLLLSHLNGEQPGTASVTVEGELVVRGSTVAQPNADYVLCSSWHGGACSAPGDELLAGGSGR